MHGNVSEWVADCWHHDYVGAPTDGTAKVNNCSDNDQHSVHGGSLSYVSEDLRAADRSRFNTDIALNFVGFCLARTLL